MRYAPAVVLVSCLVNPCVAGSPPPLLPERDVVALAQEVSGEAAKRTVEGLARFHRQRGSRGFHAAAALVAETARGYGLADATVLTFPADGTAFYGTQRSRPAWDADFAELWELRKNGDGWAPALRIADLESMPVSLAEDSESGEVAAPLVDVGDGTAESDYAGKDVNGALVLAAAQPSSVQRLAVDTHGAAGIVSSAQNQRTAWWGEDENLVRWGHLLSFPKKKTFAFMVSLKTARAYRERLARREEVRLRAVVRAGQHSGVYEVVTATIPGVDPRLKDDEIAFSCHLDHERPGANDNASGAAAILEVARTLSKLIAEGRLPPPRRTIRFIWPPEVEGTEALLNARPDLARRIKAVVHMDMVGGGPETKAVFHVTRGPASLPSFVHAVAQAFGTFANEETEAYAGTGAAAYPLAAPEGGKDPLRAELAPYSMGSDHDVYQDGAFRIPAIYLNDWPDRYIHTNFDAAANIDATKLKRAAFIGAASGYFLAMAGSGERPAMQEQLAIAAARRHVTALERATGLSPEEKANLAAREAEATAAESSSFDAFLGNAVAAKTAPPRPRDTGDAGLVFARKADPKGPLVVFGYDYFEDHAAAAGVTAPRLLAFNGRWGQGEEYAYEVLNLANGRRTAREIRDVVASEYGPVELGLVVEYLRALERIGVVETIR